MFVRTCQTTNVSAGYHVVNQQIHVVSDSCHFRRKLTTRVDGSGTDGFVGMTLHPVHLTTIPALYLYHSLPSRVSIYSNSYLYYEQMQNLLTAFMATGALPGSRTLWM